MGFFCNFGNKSLQLKPCRLLKILIHFLLAYISSEFFGLFQLSRHIFRQKSITTNSPHVFSAEHSGFPGKVEQSAFSVHSTEKWKKGGWINVTIHVKMNSFAFQHIFLFGSNDTHRMFLKNHQICLCYWFY